MREIHIFQHRKMLWFFKNTFTREIIYFAYGLVESRKNKSKIISELNIINNLKQLANARQRKSLRTPVLLNVLYLYQVLIKEAFFLNKIVQQVEHLIFTNFKGFHELLNVDDSIAILIEHFIHNTELAFCGFWNQPAKNILK